MSDKNIFMTALSNINLRNFKKLKYSFRDENGNLVEGKSYPGYFSGEPGIRCAIDDLLEQGLLFDKYVIFCSPKTMEQVDISDIKCDDDGKLIRGGMEEADQELYQNYISGVQGFDFDTEKNEVVEKSVSFENISAYDYIEMIIRERVYKAITEEKNEQIASWLRTKGYCEDTGVVNEKVIDEYIKAACRIDNGKPIIMDDNPDIEVIKKNIESQQSGRADKMNIYIDITGGTRITSVVAMLMSRWYEQNQMAEVKKVIYSSIMKGEDAVILDWTRNYELFKLANPKADIFSMGIFKGENDRIKECLAINGIDMETIDSCIANSRKNIDSKTQEKNKINLEYAGMILEDNEEIVNSIQGIKLIDKIDDAINSYSRSVFENAVAEFEESDDPQKEASRLLNHFFEDIVGYLIEKGVFQGKSSDIRNILKNCRWYYEKENKNRNTGVIYEIRSLLEILHKDMSVSPSKLWEDRQNLDNDYYLDKFSQKNEAKYSIVVPNNLKINERFIKKLSENIIHLQNPFDDKKISILDYERLKNIYFNYGFPFAFIVFDNHREYDGVQKDYLNKSNIFFKNLEEIYRKDKDEYIRKLKIYLDKESGIKELELEIPEVGLPDCIKVNDKKFKGEDKNTFISSLNDYREKVRMFRNAESHSDDSRFDIYRDSEKNLKLAEEIVAWFKKWQNYFD